MLVPFADAVKLLSKENLIPQQSNRILFLLVPILTLFIPLTLWCIYPSSFPFLSYKYSILIFLSLSSIGVYGLLGCGWRRNSKYSIIGAVRSVAQTVSYEVRMALILIHSILFYFYRILTPKLLSLGSFTFVSMFLLVVTSLAESNRRPFDFSEGESELVRGFNTEFSSVPFIVLFLAEYRSILFLSILIALLFNMRRYVDLFIYFLLWTVIFIWSRGTLPRLRYDQLMQIAWKCFLPLSLCWASLLLVA